RRDGRPVDDVLHTARARAALRLRQLARRRDLVGRAGALRPQRAHRREPRTPSGSLSSRSNRAVTDPVTTKALSLSDQTPDPVSDDDATDATDATEVTEASGAEPAEATSDASDGGYVHRQV